MAHILSHYFRQRGRIQYLYDQLIQLSKEHGWELHAWAVFSNHYHFVAKSPEDPSNLPNWIAKLHQITATMVNRLDGTPCRKIWHNYWDTRLSFHKSYLARLNYVHQNAVKHGLVKLASEYPWCSAAEFERMANRSFVKSVYSFDASKVQILDDF